MYEKKYQNPEKRDAGTILDHPNFEIIDLII